jgi:hypothetical protein
MLDASPPPALHSPAEYLAVAGRYVDDAPAEIADTDMVSPADREWWAGVAEERAQLEDERERARLDALFDDLYEERSGLAFPDDWSGLADADMLPGGIG